VGYFRQPAPLRLARPGRRISLWPKTSLEKFFMPFTPLDSFAFNGVRSYGVFWKVRDKKIFKIQQKTILRMAFFLHF